MYPKYPVIPLSLLSQLGWAALAGKHRSFRQDALLLTRGLPIKITGKEYIPDRGPAVFVMNHYSRPGFQAFWFTLGISAALPCEVHWTMTSTWTNDGTPGAWFRVFPSAFFLPRLARIYRFTSMPPMPPRSHEVEARAEAVRHLMVAARQTPPPILAIAPEGMDTPDGKLMRPHPGVGRLLGILGGLHYRFHPIGVYETASQLVLSFGSTFSLPSLKGSADERDAQYSDLVMQAIARQLPEHLWGVYK